MRAIRQDMSIVVDCLPGTWSEERPKRYEPISVSGNQTFSCDVLMHDFQAEQYIMKRLAANY